MEKVKSNLIIIIVFALISTFILMQSPLAPIASKYMQVDSSVFIYGAKAISERENII